MSTITTTAEVIRIHSFDGQTIWLNRDTEFFDVGNFLGGGAAGTVYECEHVHTHGHFALKILNPLGYKILSPTLLRRCSVLSKGKSVNDHDRSKDVITLDNIWWLVTSNKQYIAGYFSERQNSLRELSLNQCIQVWDTDHPSIGDEEGSEGPDMQTILVGGVQTFVPQLPTKFVDFIRRRNRIFREIRNMRKISNHVNVIRLENVLELIQESKCTIFLILELANGGELFDRIKLDCGTREETAKLFFQQLLDGVKHCHDQGVCHRDLKPENLLLQDSRFGTTLKIADFGFSARFAMDDSVGGGAAGDGRMFGGDGYGDATPVDTPISESPATSSGIMGMGMATSSDITDLLSSSAQSTGRSSGDWTRSLLYENNYGAVRQQQQQEVYSSVLSSSSSLPIDLTQSPLRVLKSVVGSPFYVAPEVMQARGYDGTKADVWSLGVILYAMLAGNLPFGQELSSCKRFRHFCKWVKEEHIKGKSIWSDASVEYPQWLFPAKFSNAAKGLIVSMLHPDPNYRVSVSDAMTHPLYIQSRRNSLSLSVGAPLSSSVTDNSNDPASITTPSGGVTTGFTSPSGYSEGSVLSSPVPSSTHVHTHAFSGGGGGGSSSSSTVAGTGAAVIQPTSVHISRQQPASIGTVATSLLAGGGVVGVDDRGEGPMGQEEEGETKFGDNANQDDDEEDGDNGDTNNDEDDDEDDTVMFQMEEEMCVKSISTTATSCITAPSVATAVGGGRSAAAGAAASYSNAAVLSAQQTRKLFPDVPQFQQMDGRPAESSSASAAVSAHLTYAPDDGTGIDSKTSSSNLPLHLQAQSHSQAHSHSSYGGAASFGVLATFSSPGSAAASLSSSYAPPPVPSHISPGVLSILPQDLLNLDDSMQDDKGDSPNSKGTTCNSPHSQQSVGISTNGAQPIFSSFHSDTHVNRSNDSNKSASGIGSIVAAASSAGIVGTGSSNIPVPVAVQRGFTQGSSTSEDSRASVPPSFTDFVKRSTRFITAVPAEEVLAKVGTILEEVRFKRVQTAIGIIGKVELNWERFRLEVWGLDTHGPPLCSLQLYGMPALPASSTATPSSKQQQQQQQPSVSNNTGSIMNSSGPFACSPSVASSSYIGSYLGEQQLLQQQQQQQQMAGSFSSSSSQMIHYGPPPQQQLYLVEFIRGHGELFAFKRFYQWVRQCLSELVKRDYSMKLFDPASSPMVDSFMAQQIQQQQQRFSNQCS